MKYKEIVVSILAVGIVIAGVIFFTRQAPKKEVDDSVFRNQFVSSCVESGSTFTYCDCSYAKIKEKVGLDEFLTMAFKYSQGEPLPDYVIKSALTCLK